METARGGGVAPDQAATEFVPSRHGFRFANRFGVPLVARTLRQAGIRATYGLCGGMVALAYDFFEHGRALPPAAAPPMPGTPLWRALVRRQIDSLGGSPFFPQVAAFARWTACSDAEAQRRTATAWPGIRRRLEAGRPVQLGLIYTRRLARLWENHQVLACGFADARGGPGFPHQMRDRLCPGQGFGVRLYDPNYPLRDDVVLRAAWQAGGRLACRQLVGGRPVRSVRGFFALPLRPEAPAGL